ncbi:G elongation factor, mitochondrial 2, variant 3 [Schistosoma haematobium]|uniref:G elongation factor, mitochondrial 2, variant 3 n=3 Tax=Schistosoma haematobium TaxID=6185 RepID=A0A6A5DA55_SCHHA|nr:G elongation factor, mitochondrial 2, variant 3 [Schistosoma haematobium]KAH9591065.1 G elongation factor, mitochondrial 2, variant 3 [Schistosoma haematobium]CAH8665443.1 unnamed protein product [Schistosoma haematobium]
MWNFHVLLSTKLAEVLKFKQPFRTRIYHFALQPKMIKYNESIDPEDPRLVKAVAPAQKWEHTGSNFDELVSRIVGMMTIRGEREVARNVMRMTFREIKLIQMRKNKSIANISESKATVINPTTVIHEAVKNCTPLLLLQSVPRGGILYKVPAPPVSSSVATHTAVKFILDAARGKPRDQRIWISLANEFMVASQNQGKAVKYKVELHKQCEENRAYANFRSH